MTVNNTCPICEEGLIHEKKVDRKFDYHGEQFIIKNYVILCCDSCHEEFVAEKHEKKFSPIICDEQRKIDGLLTSDEIKAIRRMFKLSQAEISNLLGGGSKSFARYENGTVKQSRAMDTLLRLLADRPSLINQINQNWESVSSWKPIGACNIISPDKNLFNIHAANEITQNFVSFSSIDKNWHLA